LLSSIDPREFSDLLVSGRAGDLKALADRLSQHARASRDKVPVKPTNSKPSNSKSSNSKPSNSRTAGMTKPMPSSDRKPSPKIRD
jgi:hypothetical protein